MTTSPSTERLAAELDRLYGPAAGDAGQAVRARVLEVAGPGSWRELSRVWQGVQADLALPAPAIAVNGSDGFQLWFSFAQAVQPDAADTFVQALAGRYLAGVPPERVRRPASLPPAPPRSLRPERWSAFIAADLAPLFEETPWLDEPVGAGAQADLLARLQPIAPDAFTRACAPPPAPPAPAPAADATPAPQAGSAAATGSDLQDPRSFLLSVMRDASVDLALRVEAAKALLADESARR
jgi:hypothetical protein